MRITHVERAVHRPAIILKGSRVHEERRHKIHSILPRKLGVLHELGLPPIGSGVLAELAVLTGERGGEGATVVFELVWVVGVGFDVVAEEGGVGGARARDYAGGKRMI